MAIKIPRLKKKNTWRSKLVSAALGLAALAIIAFLAVCNWRIYNNRHEMEAQIEKLQEQVQVLEERRATLQAGLNAAQGDSFQEEKMREQGYKRPGEEVIAVLQDSQANATKQEGQNGDNFWLNLWENIKGLKP
ncbi:MAG: septum formation initiator family protein [Candidatus Pacebacteria bacterium]|nr:septum formation initiator family protein [Candidatus Paceibacterota bacterium]